MEGSIVDHLIDGVNLRTCGARAEAMLSVHKTHALPDCELARALAAKKPHTAAQLGSVDRHLHLTRCEFRADSLLHKDSDIHSKMHIPALLASWMRLLQPVTTTPSIDVKSVRVRVVCMQSGIKILSWCQRETRMTDCSCTPRSFCMRDKHRTSHSELQPHVGGDIFHCASKSHHGAWLQCGGNSQGANDEKQGSKFSAREEASCRHQTGNKYLANQLGEANSSCKDPGVQGGNIDQKRNKDEGNDQMNKSEPKENKEEDPQNEAESFDAVHSFFIRKKQTTRYRTSLMMLWLHVRYMLVFVLPGITFVVYLVDELDEEDQKKIEMIKSKTKEIGAFVAKKIADKAESIGTKVLGELTQFANVKTGIKIDANFSKFAKAGVKMAGKALLLAAHAASEVLFLVKPMMVIVDAFNSMRDIDSEVQTILSRLLKFSMQLWGIMISGVAERCRGIEGKKGILSELKLQVRRVLTNVLVVLTRVKGRKRLTQCFIQNKQKDDGSRNSIKLRLKISDLLEGLKAGQESKNIINYYEKRAEASMSTDRMTWIEVWPSAEPDGQTFEFETIKKLPNSENSSIKKKYLKIVLNVDAISEVVSEDTPEEPLKTLIRKEILNYLEISDGQAEEKKKKTTLTDSIMGWKSGIEALMRNAFNAVDRKSMFLEMEEQLKQIVMSAHFKSTLMVMDTVTKNQEMLQDLHKFHLKVNQSHLKINNPDLRQIWEKHFPHLLMVDIQDFAPVLATWKLDVSKGEEVRANRGNLVTRKDFVNESAFEIAENFTDMLVFLDQQRGKGDEADSKVHYMEANVWFPREKKLNDSIEEHLAEFQKWQAEDTRRVSDLKKKYQDSLKILSERIEEEDRMGRTTEALLMKGMEFSLLVRATLCTLNFLEYRKVEKLDEAEGRERNRKFEIIQQLHIKGPQNHRERLKVGNGLLVQARYLSEKNGTKIFHQPSYKIAIEYLTQASDEESLKHYGEESEQVTMMILTNLLWDEMLENWGSLDSKKPEYSKKIESCRKSSNRISSFEAYTLQQLTRLLQRIYLTNDSEKSSTAAFFLSLLYRDLYEKEIMENPDSKEVAKKKLHVAKSVKWFFTNESRLPVKSLIGNGMDEPEAIQGLSRKVGRAALNKILEIHWCEYALEKGEKGYILSNLAYLYGFIGEYEKKKQILKKGSDLNDAVCLYNLADEIKKDGYKETVLLLERAGNIGHVPSLQRLAVYHFDKVKRKGIEKSEEEGLKYIRMAMDASKDQKDYETFKFLYGHLEMLIDNPKRTIDAAEVSRKKVVYRWLQRLPSDSFSVATFGPRLEDVAQLKSRTPTPSPRPNTTSGNSKYVSFILSSRATGEDSPLTPTAKSLPSVDKQAKNPFDVDEDDEDEVDKPAISQVNKRPRPRISFQDMHNRENKSPSTRGVVEGTVEGAVEKSYIDRYKEKMEEMSSNSIGNGVEELNIASDLLKKAIENGEHKAAHTMYKFVDKYRGTRGGYRKIRELLEFIVDTDKTMVRFAAAYRLACYYKEGRKGIPKDETLYKYYMKIKSEEIDHEDAGFSRKVTI
eukprot:jgi/Bigna1/68084/fgenesh1_pg.5_\